MPNWMQSSFGKVFLINVLQTQRLKSSSFDEHMNICWSRGGGGTLIWKRRGCLSEILNLTPKGDHPVQAFCDA